MQSEKKWFSFDSKLFEYSLAIIWLQESLTCDPVCYFINLFFMLLPQGRQNVLLLGASSL